MYIRDVMRAPVITIAADARLDRARTVMQLERIEHLPVLQEGAVVGLLTRRDLRRVAPVPIPSQSHAENVKRCGQLLVSDIMSPRIVTLASDTPAREAARLMWEEQAACILVLHAGKLIGIVTVTDLLDVLVDFLDSQWPARYRHLLVPVDFGATTVHAVRKATILARQHQADITLLYVLPRLSTMIEADMDHISAELLVKLVEDCRAEALQRLADLVPPNSTSRINCEVVDGVSSTAIVNAAVRIKTDLIIMGRRRQGFMRLFRRNVAREVVRRAPCPVLLVEAQSRYEFVRVGH